jgi:hypothetical protein
MKILLYIFAFVWLMAGLGALIGGWQIGMGALLGGDSTVSGDGAPDAATLGWFWLWTFPMPSLLAGALGAVLGRLDDIREAIEFANEQDDTDDIQAEPEERVTPYIGEGSLGKHPDTHFTASKQDHSLS